MFTARESSVLIVEDDDDVRDAFAEVAERAGYRVTTARHGGEALAILDRAEPDVVVLDLMMPVVDGFEVLRQLQANDRDIPVVVVSAARAPELPANVGFVAKPTRRDELLAAIAARCPPQIIEPPPKIDATLYVAPACAESERARRVLASVLSVYDQADVRCAVIDVTQARNVERVHAPALVIHHPLRLTLLGGPTDTRFLMGLFDMAEVPRRRW